MTGDPGRAFWKLGERHFLGPIPRPDFLAFLRRGFETYGHEPSDEALVRLLDVADDVPYNVQRIAYVAWELLRVEPDTPLTMEVVERALTTIITQEHPAYAQLWTSLTTPQKKVLKAVILEGGRGLTSADVLRRHGVAAATMHKTLGVLDDKESSGRTRRRRRRGTSWRTRSSARGSGTFRNLAMPNACRRTISRSATRGRVRDRSRPEGRSRAEGRLDPAATRSTR